MMNKMKSAGVHIVKFLFILPLIAVLLVAFRNKWESPAEKDPVEKKVSVAGLVVDAATHEPVAGATIISRQLNILVQTDAKGYYKFDLPFENRDLEFSLVIEKKGYTPMQQQEHWGNFYVDAIYQTYGKTIEFFALGKEGAGNGFSTIAGNPTNAEGLSYENVLKWFPFVKAQVRAASYIGIDTVPYIMNPNSKGYFIEVIGVNGECTVVVKDKKGKEIERVMLNQWKEQKKFEEQYGEILAPPPQPPTPPANAMAPVAVAGTELPVAPVPPAVIAPFPPNLLECPVADMAPPPVTAAAMNYNNLGRVSSEWEITDKKAEIKLKDGTVEKYNLTDLKEKAAFEKKYGKIYHINTNVNANVATTVNTNVNSNVNANVNTVITIPPYKVATGSNLTTSVAPVAIAGNGFSAVSSTTPLPAGSAITMIDPYGYVITGNEDIVIRITKSTTREELEKFKTQMKAKGVELDFDEIEYNDKGILVSINGTMKSGDSRSNFVATDFESVVLAMVKKGQKTYFKVSTKDREVI